MKKNRVTLLEKSPFQYKTACSIMEGWKYFSSKLVGSKVIKILKNIFVPAFCIIKYASNFIFFHWLTKEI